MQAAAISGELNALNNEERKVADSGWSVGEREERLDRIDVRMRELNTMVLDLAAAKVAGPAVRSAPPAVASTIGDPYGSAEYRSGFWKFCRTGNPAELRAAPITTTSSNVPVPTDMERSIVELLYQPLAMLGVCRRTVIDSDRTITVEAGLPTTAALVAENPGSAVTLGESTFNKVDVAPFKFVCATQATYEYLEDAAVTGGGQEFLTRKIANALAIKMEDYFATGTGSSEPKGLVNWVAAGNTVKTGATTTGLTGANADKIIDLVHAVAPQYRTGNFRVMLNDATLKSIRTMKVDGSSYEYLWKPGTAQDLTAGVPGTIYGVPYVVNQSMPSYVSGTAKKFLAVGNFDYAYIFERPNTSVIVDPYSNAGKQLVAMYITRRADFAVVNADAFAILTNAA